MSSGCGAGFSAWDHDANLNSKSSFWQAATPHAAVEIMALDLTELQATSNYRTFNNE
jgi:hypothetical protein